MLNKNSSNLCYVPPSVEFYDQRYPGFQIRTHVTLSFLNRIDAPAGPYRINVVALRPVGRKAIGVIDVPKSLSLTILRDLIYSILAYTAFVCPQVGLLKID